MRNKIQERLGPDTVDEVVRWNDLVTDSYAHHGVALSAQEERVQQDMLELMAVEELTTTEEL